MLEIHAPNAGENSSDGKDRRPGCQSFVDYVLFDGHRGLADQNRGGDGVTHGIYRGVDARQVVIDIAEIFLCGGADRRHAPAVQFSGRFHQRHGCMFEYHDLALEVIKLLNVSEGGALVEETILDGFQLRLQVVYHRKVAVHYRVHQRIKHEARTQTQQFRFALATLAYTEKMLFAAVADGEDEVASDEDADLADRQFGVIGFHYVHHYKQRIAVFFNLGSLVSVPGIFDRQVVQPEFFLHFIELGIGGIA